MIKPKIFYSEKCKFCIELLSLINSSSVSVELINIDFHSYPKNEVFSVPTMIAPGFIKPLVGKAIFEWVKNQRFFNSSSNNINLSKNIPVPSGSSGIFNNNGQFQNTKNNTYCSINESTNLLI